MQKKPITVDTLCIWDIDATGKVLGFSTPPENNEPAAFAQAESFAKATGRERIVTRGFWKDPHHFIQLAKFDGVTGEQHGVFLRNEAIKEWEPPS
jgi:hypothetical protein